MGIDVRIVIRAKPRYDPPSPDHIDGTVTECTYIDGYTHEVCSMTRYYGVGYERGPWPEIAAYLLRLLADENVESIGYGGDDDDHLHLVTLEWLTQMNLHYIDNCERPYRLDAKPVKRVATLTISR